MTYIHPCLLHLNSNDTAMQTYTHSSEMKQNILTLHEEASNPSGLLDMYFNSVIVSLFAIAIKP